MIIEPIVFRKTIPAGTVNYKLEHRLKGAGHLENLVLHFTPGQQEDLQVAIYREVRGSKTWEPLTNFADDSDIYHVGDDVTFTYPINHPIQNDDKLIVVVTNKDQVNDYTLFIDVIARYITRGDR